MSHDGWWLATLEGVYVRWDALRLVPAGLDPAALRRERPHFRVASVACLQLALAPGLRYRVPSAGEATRWHRLGRDEVFALRHGDWAQRDCDRAYDQLKLALEPDRIELVRNTDGAKRYHDAPAPATWPWTALLDLLRARHADPVARHAAWGLLLGGALETLRHQPRRRDPGLGRFRLLCDHLREHLAEEVSRDQLAAVAGCHRSHVTRLFQQHAGCGYLEWLERERLAAVRELLAVSDLPLATIAERCGFRSATYLIRRFKAGHQGTTPARWRQGRRGAG